MYSYAEMSGIQLRTLPWGPEEMALPFPEPYVLLVLAHCDQFVQVYC